MSRTSFTMSLLLLAAFIAFFLGSVGIYGVISYIVSQRISEMGVRLALGADSGQGRGMILMQGMRLAREGSWLDSWRPQRWVVSCRRCCSASVPSIL